MSQALSHFQSDESFQAQLNADEAKFLRELQTMERANLEASIQASLDLKTLRLAEKMEIKRTRLREKVVSSRVSKASRAASPAFRCPPCVILTSRSCNEV